MARSSLRSLRETEPTFWKELTAKNNNTILPPENIPQPEDVEIDNFDGGLDDSDVPIHVAIENIVKEAAPKGYVVVDGGLEANVDAENFEMGAQEDSDGKDCDDKELELGRGKRRKRANRLYENFWRHDDDSSSDEKN